MVQKIGQIILDDKLYYGGLSVTVKQVPDSDLVENHGCFNFNTTTITICSTLSDELKESALIHEYLHLISEASGIDLTEQQVRILEMGMYQLFNQIK